MSKNRLVPVIEITLATLFFSTSGIWTKTARMDAFVLAFFRSLIPVLFLSVLHFMKREKVSLIGSWNKRLAWASVLNAMRSLLFFQALILTEISKAVIMLYTWPVFALIISLILKRESLSFKKLLLLMASIAGILIIYLENLLSDTLEWQDLAGMSVMMMSAFIYSITFVIFKEEGKERSHFEITFFQNFAAVPIFLLATLVKNVFFPGDPSSMITLQGIGFASLNGLIVGIFGFLLYFKGMNQLPGSVASQMAYLEIVFAITWGILIYGEQPGVPFALGAVLIISGALGRSFIKD